MEANDPRPHATPAEPLQAHPEAPPEHPLIASHTVEAMRSQKQRVMIGLLQKRNVLDFVSDAEAGKLFRVFSVLMNASDDKSIEQSEEYRLFTQANTAASCERRNAMTVDALHDALLGAEYGDLPLERIKDLLQLSPPQGRFANFTEFLLVAQAAKHILDQARGAPIGENEAQVLLAEGMI